MKKYIVGGAVAAALALSASPALAADTLNCPDIGHQVDTSKGDPHRLDRDGDGVGCETYPGPPRPLETASPSPTEGAASPAPADTKTPAAPAPKKDAELAKTGWGPGEHPVRWMGATGGLLVGGAAVVFVTRRRAAE